MNDRLLEGIRVIDFTHIFSGPLATQILGDMGAEVIKIERPPEGDAARRYGQASDEQSMGGAFLALNRNKRSVAVDLASRQGQELVKRLIRASDVVVQNFRVGLMERWGLDYESLAADQPDLVYCSISGFGHTGPLATKAANDLAIQAYSGLLSFTGEPGGDPVRCGTAIADFSAGIYAALGIVGALAYRARTGAGQHVCTSMLESQVSLQSYFFADYWLKGILPQPLGTANRLGQPNQAFRTRDGWVVITSANEPMWRRCCIALGDESMADDPRFATLADRYQHTGELTVAITELTMNRTTAQCLADLEQQGVSCAPLNTLDEVADDDQLGALGAFVDVDRGDGGDARVVGTPLHYSKTPLDVRSGVPTPGQHTVEVLTEILGEDELSRLRATGVVGAVT